MLFEKVSEKRQKTGDPAMGQTAVEVLKVRTVKEDSKVQTGVVAAKVQMTTEMVQTQKKPEDFRGY
jgi:hypothetical protein